MHNCLKRLYIKNLFFIFAIHTLVVHIDSTIPIETLTEKPNVFPMQIMRGTHVCLKQKNVHHFHMYITDIHTQKSMRSHGIEITNVSTHAKHMKNHVTTW